MLTKEEKYGLFLIMFGFWGLLYHVSFEYEVLRLLQFAKIGIGLGLFIFGGE